MFLVYFIITKLFDLHAYVCVYASLGISIDQCSIIFTYEFDPDSGKAYLEGHTGLFKGNHNEHLFRQDYQSSEVAKIGRKK